MVFEDRIQKNPRLLRLKDPRTNEIVDFEIQDLTTDEVIQEGTEINAKVFNKFQEKIDCSEKLIYSKIIDEDITSFDITDIKIEENKQYRIVVDGLLSEVGTNDLITMRLILAGCDNTIVRNIVLTTDLSPKSYFSATENIKVLRTISGYSAIGDTIISYKNGLVKAKSNICGMGDCLEQSVSSQIGTMLGRFKGDIDVLHFETSAGKIIAGATIKIFELP